MTENQARERALTTLAEITGGDPEVAHSEADGAILKYLREVAPEIAEAWEDVDDRCGGFWYA